MKETNRKSFANGVVYALETNDGFPVEVTDTFLPFYTKDAIGKKQNALQNNDLGDRNQRWMIGVSCMSGCPVGCKFCATGTLDKWRNLTADEIEAQIDYALSMADVNGVKWGLTPQGAKEFKINYTRMGEPFLNLDAIKETVRRIDKRFPGTHHYVSTIGVEESDFSWVKDNITLQISLHSLNEERRDNLIPWPKKMSIEELGQIRTKSNLKTTLNLTLVDEEDFDIEILKKWFDPEYFFIKLSPINENEVSESNQLGSGVIEAVNLA